MMQQPTKSTLLSAIAQDLSQHLWHLVVFLAVISTGFLVILNVHYNRQLAIKHEQLLIEKDQLDIEWRNMMIEQSALTEHSRIEQQMNDALNMRRPKIEDEILVKLE